MAPGLALNLLLSLLSLLFLLFCAPAGAQEPQTSEVAGAVGGVALLNPQNLSQYSQLHWRWQNRVKVAVRRRGEQPGYPPSRFEGRLELLQNGTLRVGDLSLGDSGEFRLHLEDEAGRESVQRVQLRVYDVVPKPLVTATTSSDPRVCNATLNCSVPLQGVTYEWIPPPRALRSRGPVLELSLGAAEETFVCRVSNAASASSAALTWRPPCTWTDGSSSSSSSSSPAPLALGRLLLLFLILLFLVLAVA